MYDQRTVIEKEQRVPTQQAFVWASRKTTLRWRWRVDGKLIKLSLIEHSRTVCSNISIGKQSRASAAPFKCDICLRKLRFMVILKRASNEG